MGVMDMAGGAAAGMNPMSAGLGALESITGGEAGPSTATSTVNNSTRNSAENGFKGGNLNMGSQNGLPMWALLAAGVAVFYIMMGKK